MDAAKSLAAKIDISTQRLVLITASHKFVYLPVTLRTLTTAEGTLEDHAFLPYGNVLQGRGDIVYGKAEAIEPSKEGKHGIVKLEGGESVYYDVLVLATGNKWPGAIDFPKEEGELKEHLGKWRAKIEKARSIVFVGGGLVGVEWAAEVLDFHQVSLVVVWEARKTVLTRYFAIRTLERQ